MPRPLLNERPPPAKERARQKAEEKARLEKQAIEDASWEDTRKPRKSDMKKAEAAAKRHDDLNRKAERKAIEAKETAEISEARLKRQKAKGKTKMTMFQIQEASKKALAERKKASKLEQANITTAAQYADILDGPNRNRETDTLEASGVDNVLRVLSGTSIKSPPVGGGPDFGAINGGGGAAAAAAPGLLGGPMSYKQFEAARMPSIKLDKPGLKASQYRDFIRKEWQRSPQNPKNAPS
mmetsp:Transcript_5066/g.15428  ORF Transcript_5066/g.15428 Transcript_5066/m.15428 type:complete len:239 (-) Transcript_5066:194-910(-)